MYSRLIAAVCLLLSTTLAWADDPDTQALEMFEAFYEESVELSPMRQTRLGRKTQYGEWDDISPTQDERYLELHQDQLERLQALNPEALSEDNRLSYELMHYQLRHSIDGYRWRDHNYPVNQMFGWHTTLPSLLMNQHRVDDVDDAMAYISRLEGIGPLLDQLIKNLRRRELQGIIPPRFVFSQVQRDIRNLTTNKPFETDFRTKVRALELSEEAERQLLRLAERAILRSTLPGYQRLSHYLTYLETRADDRAGAWKLPEGEGFYDYALQNNTTTDLSAEQVHKIGLGEVERIHDEIRVIMDEVGFDGSLEAFFDFTQSDPQFFYPDTEEGREAYLEETQKQIDAISERLEDYFLRQPKAELEVTPVEAYREESAGKAFYQSPAEDSSRPGIYYVNLHNMADMPKYQLEALAYHEALPGHHMQIALAQEMDELPSFRRQGGHTAYIEGWGLYAEYLPLEMGFYEDPYSNFGRLAMELWRAARLVVDTGLHSKRWTREQAIDYFTDHTPMTESDARREIERYIVMPGQATSYKIGMNKIMELREEAEEQLGDDFDLRAFHQVVLDTGSVPLTVLEQQVHNWIQDRKAALE